MQEKFHHTVVHKVDVQNLYARKGAFPKLSLISCSTARYLCLSILIPSSLQKFADIPVLPAIKSASTLVHQYH